MQKITSREWAHIGSDYKSEINGQKMILKYGNGTCLIPVEIDDSNGLEQGVYSFNEFGIGYTVLAYTEEEALRIIKDSGHAMRLVADFKRLYSLCEKNDIPVSLSE